MISYFKQLWWSFCWRSFPFLKMNLRECCFWVLKNSVPQFTVAAAWAHISTQLFSRHLTMEVSWACKASLPLKFSKCSPLRLSWFLHGGWTFIWKTTKSPSLLEHPLISEHEAWMYLFAEQCTWCRDCRHARYSGEPGGLNLKSLPTRHQGIREITSQVN